MTPRACLELCMGVLARRPRLNTAILACLAVVASGWGLWSCQTAAPVATARPGLSPGVLPATEPEMRVRIKAGASSVKLAGPEQFLVRAGVGESATIPGPITIEATDGGCRIIDARGVSRGVAGVGSVEVEGVAGGGKAAPRIKVDGVVYPGRIRISPRSSGSPGSQAGADAAASAVLGSPAGARGQAPPAKMDVIEIVPIETYLPGVVIAEMPSHWPGASFQVQAVCARTYALHERQRAMRLGRAWDLDAGEIDQAYNGGAEVPAAARAVAETRGVVVTWRGELLRAYYSSTCGGRTAGAAGVWPTGPGFEFNLAAPLQAHQRDAACQVSPVHRWSVERDRAELSRQLREWARVNGSSAKTMGLIASLSVDQANPVGRPTRYIITDDKRETYPFPAELLRVACNFNAPGVKAVTRDTRVRSGDLEMEVNGSTVTVRGRGFGHGVGMCQYCAKAMADRGDPWQDMVQRFYPGAALERAY